MDASPTPKQSVRLDLEISRAQDGRLEGQLRSDAADRWSPFSGVLELLKVIEDSLDAVEAVEAATHVQPKERN
jgi:hypothetical protein